MASFIDRLLGRGKDPTSPLDPLTKEHRKRREVFNAYWKYYRGHHHKHLKVRPNEADDNVTVNLSKKVVNQSVNFLFGQPVVFEVDEEEEERTKEEAYLDEVWEDDPRRHFNRMAFLQNIGLMGSVFGTPFVRLYPAKDNGDKPRLVIIDPSLVDVETDPDDMSQVLEYRIVWKSGDDWKRDRFTRSEMGDTWEIAREQHSGPRDAWVLVDEPILWEYEWAPLFHCQNLPNPRDFWGMSDLEDADMNDAINFVVSNTGRIIKFHAHPRTIASGISPGQIEATSVDGLWTVPSGEVYNLEMQSDLASSREHARDLKADYHTITDTPDLDPAKVQVGALSGFALRILYGPLLSKTENKRLRYGGMLARINAALLELAGMGENIQVTNKWQDPLPVSDQERAQVFNLLAAVGNAFGAARVAGYTREEAEMLTQVEIPQRVNGAPR